MPLAQLIKEIYDSKDLYRPKETMAVIGITKMSISELHGQEVFLSHQIEKILELLEQNYDFLKESTDQNE